MTTDSARPASITAMTANVRDLVALTKPRITLMVIITTAGGLWLAPGDTPWTTIVLTLIATAMVVGAANTLNCWLERDVDKHMARTKQRPLPAGRLDPRWALALGLALGAISVPVLTIVANPLTGLLAAIALVSYVWIYTPLKQRSPIALLVGSVPGALPPLMAGRLRQASWPRRGSSSSGSSSSGSSRTSSRSASSDSTSTRRQGSR